MTDRQAKAKTIEILKKWGHDLKYGFGSFTMPIIRNLLEVDLIDQLVSVQPMQPMHLPPASMFYLDLVGGRRPWWRRWFKSVRWWFYSLFWLMRHPFKANTVMGRYHRYSLFPW